ncbi:hypothetical protein [Saccharothrix sp. HUAS TT1]|uniref:hypothetical protein n=1 Tax=unclassified Saccharothrix TaxID=2593673 RepID=UPI00345C4EB5
MGIHIINGPREIDAVRSQVMLSGGGIKSSTVDGVKWSQRLLVISLGRNTRWSRDGLWEIDMPPDGTVIPSISGGASVTVANGRVPIPSAYGALWYIPPISRGQASVPGNFRVSRYIDSSNWEIPEHWVLIVSRNDDGQASLFKWGDGSTTDYWRPLSLLNNWVNYGSGYAPAWFRKGVGDLVEVRGLVANGTSNHIATLPAGFRPGSILLTSQHAQDSFARVDLHPNGELHRNIGGTSFLSINIVFHAEQ